MKAKKKSKYLIAIVIIVVLILLGWGTFNWSLHRASLAVDENNNQSMKVEIPQGSSTAKIASLLSEKGLINSEFAFKYQSKKLKYDNRYQAGNYVLSQNMDMFAIMEKIKKGEAEFETIRFTIPEGYDMKLIAEALEEKGLVDSGEFYRVLNNEKFDYRFLEGIPLGENYLEGFLFPDTYEFHVDATEKDIIDRLLQRFDNVFVDAYYERAKELGYSIREIIAMASIVEREAVLDEERPIVASVFYNRLDIDMRLQSCATVQYILGEQKARLSIADTQIESPYNTYLHVGLPPAPIASPGLKSIEAALYPADTDYIYFVAKGDGSHAFARTYDQFLTYKNKYIN
ncbi:MAG: endolytic transglycosylase MltG [Peptostreptococcales bacterium]